MPPSATTRPDAMTTILIADEDLGFVTWLGVKLASRGYATVPATSVSAARQLFDELHVSPDLAVVNLELAGAGDLIHLLRRGNRKLKVIAIEDVTPIVRPIKVDATGSRSEADWLVTVERALNLRNATRAL